MSKKADSSDLGISLKDIAIILQTGKKLTRGAKNQLKISTLDRQAAQKQSEVSFDSKKSIQSKKEAKRVDKNAKKKEGSIKSTRLTISEYIGVPDLESYITSQDLTPKSHFNLQRFNVAELGKNHLPSLMRVILKNNLSKQHYEVKRGQLKKQKTTRQQFLIDLCQPSGGRSDVRSITRENGFVLVGQNIAMMKLTFEDWKKLFGLQIEELRKDFNRPIDPEEGQKMDEEKSANDIIIQQKQIKQRSLPQFQVLHSDNLSNKLSKNLSGNPQPDQKQKSFQSCFIIDEEKSLEFVEIQPQLSGEIPSSDSQDQRQQASNRQDKYSINNSNSMKPEQKVNGKFDQNELFCKFCIPGYDFALWPVLIYETVLGDAQQAAEVIKHKKYAFNEKDRQSNVFESIGKSTDGLFQPYFNRDIKSQSLISPQSHSHDEQEQLQKFTSNFQTSIAPRLRNQIISEQTQNQSQINLIAYPFASGKLLYFQSYQEAAEKLYTWDQFSSNFINFYLLNSYFKQANEQIFQTVDKLNEFTKLQISECKLEDIRSSIDRLVKCQVEGKIYNGITLRYSNIQKKVLLLLFANHKTTQNQLIWLNIEQIYPNYTLPQLNLKNKFLLYFSNDKNQFSSKSLTQFLLDIYASYFHKPTNHTIFSKAYYRNRSLLAQCSPHSNKNSSVPNRCVQCHYPIHKLQFYKCCFCQSHCHKQCSTKIINKSIQINFEGLPDLWTCNACEPCTLCLQPLANKRISCMKCKNMFHQICGKLKIQQNTLHRDRYLCENCIQCKICQKKLKNLDYVLMKGGYQCVNCYKAEQANQICHICKKQGDGRWAQCSRQFCGKWIHKNCDKYIQSRNNFFSNNNEEVYYCPFCRKVQKRRIILKFIQILTVFDEYQYFIGSDYEEILDYKYVIMKPMCFRKMYERCLEGAYDENTKENLCTDFNLLISNALKYNMPKDQPHYQARILNILGNHTLQKFNQQLQCTEEDLIQGHLLQRLNQKKRQLFRQIYDRYLQIILNYKSQNSTVEVKKPKQAISKGQKMAYLQIGQMQSFAFSSRHLLKEVFRSSMLKFKIKKKSSTIQNLFDIHKVIDSYKCPIKENFCFYHYWNSNVIFYCEICMQHFCCSKKCYKHHICTHCGLKGCACDINECGCPPLKQKERKTYEKLINEKYYDRRQITQNFTHCLRCACQKLNTKICCYCEKAYEFYYDFQTCKDCSKIYHKQCGDVHASQSLSKFFFKKEKIFHNQELFSNTLRLDKTCYECSISRSNKTLMFEKLKSQSLSKLMKLQKLCKYQLLIAAVYHQNGIKLSLNDILNLILNNYDDFLEYEPLFQEYRLNMPSIRLNTKLQNRLLQNTALMIQQKALAKVNQVKIIAQNKVQQLKKKSLLLGYLSLGSERNSKLQMMLDPPQIWQQKRSIKSKQFIASQLVLYSYESLDNAKKIKTQIILQKFQKSRVSLKTKKIQQLNQQINVLNTVPPPSSKKNFNSSSSQKISVWSKSLLLGSSNLIKENGSKNNNEKQDKNLPFELFSILYEQICFKSFIQIQIQSLEKIRQNSINMRILRKDIQRSLLAPKKYYDLLLEIRSSTINPLVYDINENHPDSMMEEEIQPSQKDQLLFQKVENTYINYDNQKTHPLLDVQAQIQSAVKKMYFEQQFQSQQQTQAPSSIQQEMMKIHCYHTNLSKLSKYKRLGTIHQIISKFLLRCFEFNKNFYRRGNTCILKAEPENWRVLKKGKTKDQFHQISLKKQYGKWYFSINENTWWIQSIQQMISKLQPLVKLSNFRELADFLGFTFKFIPTEKAVHFTRFLQTNPLQELSPSNKKEVIIKLYDKFEWMRNGSCKIKVTEEGKQDPKEYVTTKKKIFYLNKRKQKGHLEEKQSKVASTPPYITYEDLKKDLQQIIQSKKQQPLILTEPGDNVFIGPSPIHKLGLFAKQNYPKHTTMVEYIGQVVSESMADVRESRFHFGCYMFGLNRRNCDKRQIIDATFKGNMARYLNHSCDPNCKARIQMVNSQPSIFIYSIREISQFEELTYDYQFSVDANQKLVCTCGAKNCQGRLN